MCSLVKISYQSSAIFFILGELSFPLMSSTHLWLQAVDSFLFHFLFFLGYTTESQVALGYGMSQKYQ